METQPNDLKRLSFVAHGTSLAYKNASPVAERVYKSAKAYVPSAVQPEIAKLEESLLSATAPLAAKASDACDRLLHYADEKVDYLVLSADKGKTVITEMNENNMKTFRSATETYMSYISKAGDYVAAKLTTPASQGIQATRDKLQAAIAKAREATDPDVAVQMAWDAWAAFAAYPAVAKFLETADPLTQMGIRTFYSMHDNLVKAPIYRFAVDGTAGTLNFAASTTAYKLGAHFLYPMVRPVADVAYAKVTQSKVINGLVDYWRPAAVAT